MCLFATHFHELTALAKQQSGVVNKHVGAYVEDDEMVLLYQLKDGPCTQSFGINVAKTAGFPPTLLAHAKRKADLLEADEEKKGGKEEEESRKASRKTISQALEKFQSIDMELVPKTLSAAKMVKEQSLRSLFPAVC